MLSSAAVSRSRHRLLYAAIGLFAALLMVFATVLMPQSASADGDEGDKPSGESNTMSTEGLQFTPDGVPAMVTSDRIRYWGCVLRFESVNQGPYIHRNSAHIAPGCKSLKVEKQGIDGKRIGAMVLRFTDSRPIVNFTIDNDERLISRDVQCGGSGGPSKIVIFCYHSKKGRYLDLSKKSDARLMAGPFHNLWVQGISYAN